MYCASLFSDKGWKAKYCFQLLWRWTPARCLNHSLFSGHMLSGNLTCFLLQWTTMKTTSFDLLKLTGKQCQQFRLLLLLHYLLNWVKLDNHLRIKYQWDPIMITFYWKRLLSLEEVTLYRIAVTLYQKHGLRCRSKDAFPCQPAY